MLYCACSFFFNVQSQRIEQINTHSPHMSQTCAHADSMSLSSCLSPSPVSLSQARRLAIFHENTLLADWRFTPTTAVIGSLDTSTRAVARLVREMWAAGTLPSAPGTSLPLPPLTPRELATDTPFAYIVPQEERKDGCVNPNAQFNCSTFALFLHTL